MNIGEINHNEAIVTREGKPTPSAGRLLISAINLLIGRTGGILGEASGELPTYTVATLPDAVTNARRMIYVSNETGGAVPAFSDGTDWRRITDRAVVS